MRDEDLRRFAQQVGNRIVRRKLNPPITDARAAELLADLSLLRAEFEARHATDNEPRAVAEQPLIRPALAGTPQTASIGTMLLLTFISATAVIVPSLLGFTALRAGLEPSLVGRAECSQAVLGKVHCLKHYFVWQPSAPNVTLLFVAAVCFLIAGAVIGGLLVTWVRRKPARTVE